MVGVSHRNFHWHRSGFVFESHWQRPPTTAQPLPLRSSAVSIINIIIAIIIISIVVISLTASVIIAHQLFCATRFKLLLLLLFLLLYVCRTTKFIFVPAEGSSQQPTNLVGVFVCIAMAKACACMCVCMCLCECVCFCLRCVALWVKVAFFAVYQVVISNCLCAKAPICGTLVLLLLIFRFIGQKRLQTNQLSEQQVLSAVENVGCPFWVFSKTKVCACACIARVCSCVCVRACGCNSFY